MGTEKRQRQKANRQQRIIEEARVERSATIKRNVVRWSLAAVLAIGAVVLVAWIGGAFSGDDGEEAADVTTPPADTVQITTPPVDTTPVETLPMPDKPVVETPDTLPGELVVTDLVEGEGSPVAEGDEVFVHYVGVRSEDGTEFDNSYDRGEPISFVVGSGGVIEGWEQGLVGARLGGQRQLDIPADLAYGDQPRGDVIQAGDSLTFVVDVVGIRPAASE